MPTNKGNRSAYAAALLYAFIIGFSFLFVKFALTAASPLDTLAHRFTISLAAAAALVLFGPFKLSIRLRDIAAILPLAMLYPTLFFTFQTFGLAHTTSSEAGIVQAMAPALTMILAAFVLKERPGLLQLLSVLLSVAGVVYIFVMKGARLEAASLTGVGLIALAALSLAGYGVLTRKLAQSYRVIDITFLMSLIGFVAFNGLSVAAHVAEGSLSAYFQPFISPLFTVSILYLGVLSSLGSSLLSNFVLSRLETYKMSAFNNMATLITILAGVVMLGERLTIYHGIGAVMIIAGVLGANLPAAGKRKARTVPNASSAPK
ncbi:DMT family transporter [Paenibacillus ginsengarvi]|uniref:DMT family transporter n=1 Tax=Paenibacillus ginsengarvi TaxID=400777 RepID=A0A3B0CKY1_9BACL|nr:DMT family transporter [Paenibacillus ginsengarvi]RKN84997.1 DMT family transporter [Paenibacillus ginsengarvi]